MAPRGSGTTDTTTITTTTRSSSSSSSDSPKPTTDRAASESFLSRKKKELVDRSMALFQLSLDQCLDKSVSAASSSSAPGAAGARGVGEGIKRRAKRAREDHDLDLDDSGSGSGGGGGKGGAETSRGGGGGSASKKKKVGASSREGGGGKRFACPFCKHDPGKYRKERTCCGPGWKDVHRVKEHVYRRHSLKNLCPRCFEHFDKPESLKNHQRADVPCKVKDKGPEVITEEQEERLRARAKSHCSEDSKWEEMYRTIFPGEKVPTPYYDPATDGSLQTESGRFQSLDECREFLRTEIPRLVRPAMELYVNTLFEEVQKKVNQKTIEIIRDVETKVLLTFRFQEEQQQQPLVAAVLTADTPAQVAATDGEGGEPGPELSKVSQMLEGLRGDPHYHELCSSMHFDVEDLLASTQGIGCDAYSVDSAYWTSSSSGGQGSFGVDYFPGY